MTSKFKAMRFLSHIEESPWIRNWQHLSPMPRAAWMAHRLAPSSVPAPVAVKDRIRQWNIAPGDRICVRGDKERVIQEVLGVNRYRNMVFLKARQDEPPREGQKPKPPGVIYARCQIYIGDREFPPLPGETEPRVLPVFASRIRCSAPKYVVALGRFDWQRYAVQTTPRIGDRDEKVKIPIPWPKPPAPHIPAIEMYDTPADVAKEITWRPSSLFYPPSSRTKAKLLQDAYLHSIRPPPSSVPTIEYDPSTSPPIEYALGHELANPHSRSKKQQRGKEHLVRRRIEHKRFMEAELANLDGRTRKEAAAEGEFKWRERCRKEDQERGKNRWVLRGAAARLRRRRERKERKERRELVKMRDLLLPSAPNQVLPGTQPSSQV